MNDFTLIILGAAISLVSSVSVTWLQARYLRRTELRATARESTRQLTSMFIAERDNPAETTSKEPSANLTEAEMTAAALADRRTRERVRALIRLLRELKLPELQELSGTKPERARQQICDHALEVLGAHFRAERIPGLPQSVRKILDVEDEALNIHAGGGTSKPDDTAASEASSATGSAANRGGARRKSQAVPADGKSATKKTGDKGKEKDVDSSEFWNND
ncbi:hypothetical protein F4561_006001 [Lipingzhangella halophila]|uniref:Uncharacterized protein n=1 Tax=Lipingzhangella halophila TaxID=1783352 RepID=A0A7W7RNR0_9ACTN|nr:hypothetical protein [Lipingzhangella halophila]MBB4935107.1 hypothetical protein [Lipingzhangella halophila]